MFAWKSWGGVPTAATGIDPFEPATTKSVPTLLRRIEWGSTTPSRRITEAPIDSRLARTSSTVLK